MVTALCLPPLPVSFIQTAIQPLSRPTLKKALIDFYGIEQVLWLGDGIAGDDTNGHIDDLTRFTTNDTVITMVEPDKNDENHAILNKNLAQLKKMRLFNGKQLNIAEIPLPEPLYFENHACPFPMQISMYAMRL